MHIAAPHLANLLEFSSCLGYLESGLKQHLLNPDDDLSLFENSITDTELILIINQLLRETDDDYLGLHYGCFLNIKAMGLIFTISKSATDIDQAITLLKNFMEGTFPAFKFTTSRKGKYFFIEIFCNINDSTARKHLSDATLCVMYRELRLITDNDCEIRAHFPYANINEYRKMIGEDVQKGESYILLIDKNAIDKLLSKKNLLTIAELLPSFLHIIERTKGMKNFSSHVKKMILSMSDPELPGFDKVASQFGMSTRSFQRKLNEEGNSFRKISNQIKRELSLYLEKSKNLKTRDIAYLLGYSEASAYLHALKKWKAK